MAEQDYYKLLGVDATATAKELGKAFRQRARQTHPDKLPPGSSEAAKTRAKQQFQEISKAWEVLGDPQKRADYDSSRADSAAHTRQAPRPAQRAPRPKQRAEAQRQPSAADEERRRKQQEERAEKQRQRDEEAREAKRQLAREQRERDVTAGLGSHWVQPSHRPIFTDVENDEGIGKASAKASQQSSKQKDADSDASSELSFDTGIDLRDLNLEDAVNMGEDDSGELDGCGEVWQLKRPEPEGKEGNDAEATSLAEQSET
eukprot:TRINITY_DN114129_c0_g1_i1.p1 TRINITY_DN114129_c0_g1~~TRINITY_DN114129_c0_g1_i1.p1  ORF type:complete len:260 (-),score=87.08 TRINITY_DN114129_c0_g1_i1:52-831(-)